MVKLWYKLGCDPLIFVENLLQKAVLFIEGWGLGMLECAMLHQKKRPCRQNCECTQEDFECEMGFTRPAWCLIAIPWFHESCVAVLVSTRHGSIAPECCMPYAAPYAFMYEFHFTPAKIYKLKLYVQYIWSLFHETPYVSTYILQAYKHLHTSNHCMIYKFIYILSYIYILSLKLTHLSWSMLVPFSLAIPLKVGSTECRFADDGSIKVRVATGRW